MPQQLGLWDGKVLHQEKEGIEGYNIVIKLNDSYLGIGDSFLYKGRDFHTREDVHSILTKLYTDRTAIVMEFVVASKTLGVHSLDFVTQVTPQGIDQD